MGTGNNYARLVAVILIVAGVVEVVLGAMIRGVSPTFFGAWWAGAGCTIGGIFGLLQGSIQLRTMAYCVGIGCAIVAIAGLIVDTIGYSIVNALDTCMSDSGIYGDQSLEALADVTQCRVDHDGFDCTCVNTRQSDICYSFDLNHDKENCGQILGKYNNLLFKSVACLEFLVVLTIIYCIFLCILSLCPTACASICLPGCCKYGEQSDSSSLASQQHYSGGTISGVSDQVIYVTPPQPSASESYSYPQMVPETSNSSSFGVPQSSYNPESLTRHDYEPIAQDDNLTTK